jgi:hypothetical protein
MLASILPAIGTQSVASASPTTTSTSAIPVTGPTSMVFTTQNPSGPPSDISAVALANPAGCTLYASVVHIRQASPLNVGNKPYTKCDYAVTSISQSVQMWKNGALGPDSVGSPWPGQNSGQATYTQLNVEQHCTNTLPTYWFATVTGTMIEGGTTYYASVQTPTTEALACGT